MNIYYSCCKLSTTKSHQTDTSTGDHRLRKGCEPPPLMAMPAAQPISIHRPR